MALTKERLQFDFTQDAIERMDNMREKSGAASRAEVVRSALRLYEYFLTEVNPDNTIQILDDDKIISAFKAKLLLK